MSKDDNDDVKKMFSEYYDICIKQYDTIENFRKQNSALLELANSDKQHIEKLNEIIDELRNKLKKRYRKKERRKNRKDQSDESTDLITL